MKARLIVSVLAVMGIGILAVAWKGWRPQPAAGDGAATPLEASAQPVSERRPPRAAAGALPAEASPTASATRAAPARPSPFAAVYSADYKTFATNLRVIRCPEETLRDILTAEVHRRFQAQEEALRPTPADHVPFGWSARTTEPKLLERRQGAMALAREQAALLREALGYEVPVPLPLYAVTASEQRFEETLAGLPAETSRALRQAQETYWAGVQALQQRTKGFWLAGDVADLQKLKVQRKQVMQSLLPASGEDQSP